MAEACDALSEPSPESIDARVAHAVESLRSPDARARVAAIGALAAIGPDARAAVGALIGALHDDSWSVRIAAVAALGEIGEYSADAVPVLIELTHHEDLRASSIIALGRIGPEASAALSTLQTFTHSHEPFVRWCAEQAVRSINQTVEQPVLTPVRRSVVTREPAILALRA